MRDRFAKCSTFGECSWRPCESCCTMLLVLRHHMQPLPPGLAGPIFYAIGLVWSYGRGLEAAPCPSRAMSLRKHLAFAYTWCHKPTRTHKHYLGECSCRLGTACSAMPLVARHLAQPLPAGMNGFILYAIRFRSSSFMIIILFENHYAIII